MRKKIKSDIYKHDFTMLTALVNEWDPIGLIECGAPDDEYSCLVEKIISILYNFSSKDDFQKECNEYIRKHFGFSYDHIPEQYRLEALKHEKDSIEKIITWFLEKSFYNCNSELAKFIIKKELIEIEKISHESELISVLNVNFNHEYIESDDNIIQVYFNTNIKISYDVRNFLWRLDRMNDEELYFNTLKELLLYLNRKQ